MVIYVIYYQQLPFLSHLRGCNSPNSAPLFQQKCLEKIFRRPGGAPAPSLAKPMISFSRTGFQSSTFKTLPTVLNLPNEQAQCPVGGRHSRAYYRPPGRLGPLKFATHSLVRLLVSPPTKALQSLTPTALTLAVLLRYMLVTAADQSVVAEAMAAAVD